MSTLTMTEAVHHESGVIQTPCENPQCGTSWYGYGSNRGRQLVTQPNTGRKARYCSAACKQMVYRARKATVDHDRLQAENIRQRLAREQQAERIVRLVLGDFTSTSRGAGQKRFTNAVADEVATEIVRMLNMHGMIQ